MDSQTDETKQAGRFDGRPWEQAIPFGPSGWAATGCCGTSGNAMIEGCNCRAVFKKHRLAILAVLTGFGLTSLVVLAGFILGIVAFFRTL